MFSLIMHGWLDSSLVFLLYNTTCDSLLIDPEPITSHYTVIPLSSFFLFIAAGVHFELFKSIFITCSKLFRQKKNPEIVC
jgi:hypothetical protein